jgi:hypothetical protein
MKPTILVCSALLLGSAAAVRAQQPSDSFWTPFYTFSPVETQIVKGVPYSAEIVTEFVQTLGDGNRIVQRRTARVYRDGQGRIRREDDAPGGRTTISIVDPVAGMAFTLDPANRTARETSPAMINTGSGTYTIQLSSTFSRQSVQGWLALDNQLFGYRPRAGRVASDAVEEKLPDRTIEGVLATGTRRTTTIEKGAIGNEQPIKIVSEEWRSPELQILVLTDLNDPRTGRSTYRLLKIGRLEPDMSLFQIPPGYTIERSQAGGRGRGRRGEN